MGTNGSRHPRVAILGGGPCGNTLAILLAEKGVDVTVFDQKDRPSLIVGESLVPSILDVFRRLGIEEEVASISVRKPGATIRYGENDAIRLSFDILEGIGPQYAYNVPRPDFDELLDRRAERAGARRIEVRAELVEGSDPSREVELTRETRNLVPEWNDEHPDLIVDATGRRRAISRLLDIPAQAGPRKDVAYFAHYAGFKMEEPDGRILLSLLEESGWAWRIPLPDRVSVGVVLNADVARTHGDNPSERLESIIDRDPVLSQFGSERERITDVPVYSNYQLISTRCFGTGWVAAGDACGFVDPMLSSGLFLAMWSAEYLADLVSGGVTGLMERDFRRYQKKILDKIKAWQVLVNQFYDGGLFASYQYGREMVRKFDGWPLTPLIDRHINRNLAGMLSGVSTNRKYSRRLLKLLIGCGNGRRSALAIK